MRHALITIHLLNQARDAVIAQADADERLEHQAAAMPRTQPAQPGRLARVLTLARRVRALGATDHLTTALTGRAWQCGRMPKETDR